MTDTENIGRAIYDGLKRIADAVSADAAPGKDASGGHVNSLTEAVMGLTAGLFRIAEAIESALESEHVESIAHDVSRIADAMYSDSDVSVTQMLAEISDAICMK